MLENGACRNFGACNFNDNKMQNWHNVNDGRGQLKWELVNDHEDQKPMYIYFLLLLCLAIFVFFLNSKMYL